MNRQLRQLIPAVATSDGAGVKIRRSLGQSPGARLDPVLMLDEFNSEEASDYIAGFPAHPHRGFETVTYMLDGHMLHEDHLGNRGDLKNGGVQWMTAGRGIIHSEMPQQQGGRMRGFQLWINLPAAEKMKPAGYKDIEPGEIPVVSLGDGITLKIIAGELQHKGERFQGPINGLSTEPVYWDLHLEAGKEVSLTVPEAHNLFIYSYEGAVAVGEESARQIATGQAGILTHGSQLVLQNDEPSRVLIIGGKPIGEPIAQYGPFVMNTSEEIEQAISDYREGKLAS